LEKYLKNKNTTKDVEELPYDDCILLNYWVYSKLDEIFMSKRSTITHAFGILHMIWNGFVDDASCNSHLKKCKPDFNIPKQDDWKKGKELYDYYVNYDYLFSKAEEGDVKCKYYEYIKKKEKLYKYFEEECSKRTRNCPDFYNKLKPYNPKWRLSALHCHDKMQQKQDAASNLEQSFDTPEFRREAARSRDDPDTQLDSGNSGIGTKVTHSMLGAAQVLLTGTLLYRYTPLGTWVCRLVGGRTNSMNTMDASSTYTQETSDKFSEDTANYISYQPI
ncbi:CYIR protein, partial [Plasmodium cynomolgi strain B]